ncbi:hypothetical protein L3V79_08690 [Thiotrichales bacterium 19S9-12]|nr:hypothetical protein [Thiotrichales bacterium 19S9-11]MCF6812432.1 hypothetical protein [Thiotrichales bacterium 19S9-12]
MRSNQSGIVSVLVCMIILTLMLVTALLLVSQLKLTNQQASTYYQNQKTLDVAMAGLSYSVSELNTDIETIVSILKKQQVYNIKNLIDLDNDIGLTAKVNTVYPGDFRLLEISSMAKIKGQPNTRKVTAKFYRLDQGKGIKTKESIYVMVPGSWRDF